MMKFAAKKMMDEALKRAKASAIALFALAALLLAGAGVLHAEMDPLRQVGSTAAKPWVYIIVDLGQSMSNPLDFASDATAQTAPYDVDYRGGWRFLGDCEAFSTSSKTGPCTTSATTNVRAGYAWYEPSRIAVLKNVLGQHINVTTLGDKGCGFDASYELAPFTSSLTCSERTALWTTSATKTYTAPKLVESDTPSWGAREYPTMLCVSDPHDDTGGGGGSGSSSTETSALSATLSAKSPAKSGEKSATGALSPAFTIASTDAISAEVTFTLSAGGSPSPCTKVELLGPGGGATILKNYGAPVSALPYNVLAFYQSAGGGAGAYSLRLTAQAGGGCPGNTTYSINPGNMTVTKLVAPPPSPTNACFLDAMNVESPLWTVESLAARTQLWHWQSGNCPPSAKTGTGSWYFGTEGPNKRCKDPITGLAGKKCTFSPPSAPTVSVGGRLVSPEIFDAPAGATLSFWYRSGTECGVGATGCVKDQRYVQVSVNNGPWQNVVELSDTPVNIDGVNQWVSQSVDLSGFVSAGDDFRFAFFFDSVDGAANCGLGLMLDDVALTPACGEGGHPLWNASPCAYFSTNAALGFPAVDSTIETSRTPALLDRIYNSALGLISGLAGTMHLGLIGAATNMQTSDAVNCTSATAGACPNVGTVTTLVPLNFDDHDVAGQAYNVARINAYFGLKNGAPADIAIPSQFGGGTVAIGGLGTSSQPKFPLQAAFQQGEFNTVIESIANAQNCVDASGNPVTDPDECDERAECREAFFIFVFDARSTSGNTCAQITGAGTLLQEVAGVDLAKHGLKKRIRTFVIVYGPNGRAYGGNWLAYNGRTDANALKGDGGLWFGDPYLGTCTQSCVGQNPCPDDEQCSSSDCACVETWPDLATFEQYSALCKDGCGASPLCPAPQSPAACPAPGPCNRHDYAYFPETQDELAAAFASIFDAIGAGDHVTAAPSVTPVASASGAESFVGLLSSAEFPGWKGHLRAYNLVTEPPTEIWDAGEVLAARDFAADPREIWTSHPTYDSTCKCHPLIRIEPGAETTLAGLPGVSWIKSGLSKTSCGFNNVRAEEFIDFMLGFDGLRQNRKRPWLLGDVVNVAPTLVQIPLDYKLRTTASGDKKTFNSLYTNRKGIVYMPTNAGLLHFFDVIDGYELRAYIPPSLLDRAAEMYCNFKTEYDALIVKHGSAAAAIEEVRSPTGQADFFEGHIYTLAAPMRASDIRVPGPDSTNSGSLYWRTVALQGMGRGGSEYFALDITHPYPGRSAAEGNAPVTDPMRKDLAGNPVVYDSITPDPKFASPDGFLPDSSTPHVGKPFRVLWTIHSGVTDTRQCPDGDACFAGMGETWSVMPVGVLRDQNYDGNTKNPIPSEKYAVAFGAYFRADDPLNFNRSPESGRDAEQALNSYWIVDAATGQFIRRFDAGKISEDYDAKGETPSTCSSNCTDDTDRDKPKIPNATLGTPVMIERGPHPDGVYDRYYPDGIVSDVFVADLHGRIWRTDVSSLENGPLGGGKFIPPSSWPAPVALRDTGVELIINEFEDGGKVRVGAQPIHYSPAIGHLSAVLDSGSTLKRYVVAYSTGGWAETDPNVAGEQFRSRVAILVMDEDFDKVCQQFIEAITEMGAVVNEEIVGDVATQLTPLARVTSSPLLVVRGTAPPVGTVIAGETVTTETARTGLVYYTVYDPGRIDSSTGFCVGTAYAIRIEFVHDLETDCPTGSAAGRVMKIGIGFITMTAGPTSPILAVSGVGFGSSASLKTMKGDDIVPVGPGVTVLSWQELSCDY